MFYKDYFSSDSLFSTEGAMFEARISRSVSRISKMALSTLCRWTERMMYSKRKSPKKMRDGISVQLMSWFRVSDIAALVVSLMFVESACCKFVSSFMSLVYNKRLMLLQTVLRTYLLHIDTVHKIRETVRLQEVHGSARTRAANAVQNKFSLTRNVFELFGNPLHDYLWGYVDSPSDMATGKFKWFSYINNYSIHTTNVNQLQ